MLVYTLTVRAGDGRGGYARLYYKVCVAVPTSPTETAAAASDRRMIAMRKILPTAGYFCETESWSEIPVVEML